MGKPEKIYKYEPMSIQALKNLKSELIYFNSPRNFNDPFDCNMDLKIGYPFIDELPLIKKFIKEDCMERGVETDIDSEHDGVVAALGNIMASKFLEDKKNLAFNSSGISCFSEVNDNLLMWSHYASAGKGFCLEFNSSCEPFNAIQRVRYVKEPPKLNFTKTFSVDKLYFLHALFCTKSSHWSYEKEWRIFSTESNVAERYPTSSLTGVYFGPAMEDSFAEIVCLVLQGQHPNIKFHKGTRSSTSYKVSFEEVGYTSQIKKVKTGNFTELP